MSADLPTGSVGARTLIQNLVQEQDDDKLLLSLVANEGVLSETARTLLGSRLTDHYFNGPGDLITGGSYNDYTPFTSRGFRAASELIEAGKHVLATRIGAAHVDLSPLSGVNAMTLSLLAVSDPGDLVATVPVGSGGHFGTAEVLERTGRPRIDLPMVTGSSRIDLDALEEQLMAAPSAASAKVVYLDSSFILEPHDLAGLRRVVGPDVTVIYDASHTIGLILGGRFQDPLREGADIVTANTHKTLHGPQKGLIATRDAHVGESISERIGSGLVSSTHFGSMCALAVTLLELNEYGDQLASDTIKNAEALGGAFEAIGYRIRHTLDGALTKNHQTHVFVDSDESYQQIYGRFYRADIAANFDNAFDDLLYLRLGTQAITRRGMTLSHMTTIAHVVHTAISGDTPRASVHELTAHFPTVQYSFDTTDAFAGVMP